VTRDGSVPVSYYQDIESLAAVIRRVDGNHTLGAAELAEAIVGEWGLLFNYERLVAAAAAVADEVGVGGHVASGRELHTALAPFLED
jgi:hypothetical protein